MNLLERLKEKVRQLEESRLSLSKLNYIEELIFQLKENYYNNEKQEANINSQEILKNHHFDNIQNIYYACNTDGRVIEVSPFSDKFLDYSHEELIGKSIAEIFYNSLQYQQINEMIFKYGFVKNVTVDIINKKGSVLKCLLNSRFIKNKSGEPIKIIGSLNDISEIHYIEAKLRESENKYRELFTNANDLICTLDLAGNFSSVNPVAEKKLGYSLKQEKDLHISRYVTPESLSIIMDNINKKLQNPEDHNGFEVEAIAKDGRHFIFEVNGFIRFKGIQPYEIFAIARDITERKRTEEELQKTRERYRELFESSSDIIYTMDFEGNFTSVNPMAEKMLGYKFEDLTKLNMRDYLTPESFKRAAENIKIKLQNKAEHTTYEVDFIDKDGAVIPFEINSFLRYKDGKPSEVFGIARNINERKKNNEALRRSEEKYRMIFENAPLAILTADSKGKIIEINPALLHMLGSESIETTKKINVLTFHPLVESGVTDNFKRCVKFGESLSSEHEYVSIWGKKMVSRVYTKPFYDAEGNIISFQAIIEDITKEKESERLLVKNLLEKEALLREVHHRVKNNLQIIISLINIQISDIEEPHYRQRFKELQQRVRTMSIIHEDLYMSKDLSSVNFGNYIQKLTINLKQIYHHNFNIDLDFSLPETLFDLDTAIPLGLVVNELVSNSFKHAFPEGFTEGNTTHPRISIRFTKTKKEFKIVISDNGIGFDKKVFDGNIETLGLSLVDILISQLHGSFKFSCKKGSRYEIHIPNKDEQKVQN